MQSIISFNNVNFSYDNEKQILHNVSLDIQQGKIIAVMGGSGCGKTTLLKLISGQIKPDNGSINVLGHNMIDINPKQLLSIRKKIGMLFQFGALFTDMSVYENVSFCLHEHSNLSEDLIDKIVAMKLNAVGLFGTQNLAISQLSGGMARRVALARAIALDPNLMLYDEPFTGLDPISLNLIAMLIKELNTALNQTSILVTHDIETTFKIADYVYFMENGKIIEHGTVEQIKNTTNSAILQFINGKIDGMFSYKYQTDINYSSYIEK